MPCSAIESFFGEGERNLDSYSRQLHGPLEVAFWLSIVPGRAELAAVLSPSEILIKTLQGLKNQLQGHVYRCHVLRCYSVSHT